MTSCIPFPPTRPLPCTAESILNISFPGSCQSSVTVITFDSPSKLNSVTRKDIQTLIDLLNWISDQPQLTITIVTGKGRFFSAGADIKDPSRNPPKEISDLNESDSRKRPGMENHYRSRLATSNAALVDALITHRPLLVGALNGPSVGIMSAMLGHFDLLYSYSNFWISTPFSSLGLVAEGLASMTFVRKLGLGLAQEALLSGKRIHAQELASKGFVTRLLRDPPNITSTDKHETLPILEEVLELVKETYLPPSIDSWALLKTKELINRATYEPVGTAEANLAELVFPRNSFKLSQKGSIAINSDFSLSVKWMIL